MILIVSSLKDKHAVAVTQMLDAKGEPYYLFDTSAYPKNVQLSFGYDGALKEQVLWDITANKRIDLQKVKVAWWRRPLPIVIHEEIKDPTAIQFTYNECSAALSGLWQSMDALWVNDPLLDEGASKKIYQLKVASECGFSIPKTCISNNIQTAR